MFFASERTEIFVLCSISSGVGPFFFVGERRYDLFNEAAMDSVLSRAVQLALTASLKRSNLRSLFSVSFVCRAFIFLIFEKRR